MTYPWRARRTVGQPDRHRRLDGFDETVSLSVLFTFGLVFLAPGSVLVFFMVILLAFMPVLILFVLPAMFILHGAAAMAAAFIVSCGAALAAIAVGVPLYWAVRQLPHLRAIPPLLLTVCLAPVPAALGIWALREVLEGRPEFGPITVFGHKEMWSAALTLVWLVAPLTAYFRAVNT